MTSQQREAKPERQWCIVTTSEKYRYLFPSTIRSTRSQCIVAEEKRWNGKYNWRQLRRKYRLSCVKVTITEGWRGE